MSFQCIFGHSRAGRAATRTRRVIGYPLDPVEPTMLVRDSIRGDQPSTYLASLSPEEQTWNNERVTTGRTSVLLAVSCVLAPALVVMEASAAGPQEAGQIDSDPQQVFAGGTGASGVHCVTRSSAQVHPLGKVAANTTVTIDFNTPIGGDLVAHLVMVSHVGSASSPDFRTSSNDDAGTSLDPRITSPDPNASTGGKARDLVLVVGVYGTSTTPTTVCYNYRMSLAPSSPF